MLFHVFSNSNLNTRAEQSSVNEMEVFETKEKKYVNKKAKTSNF